MAYLCRKHGVPVPEAWRESADLLSLEGKVWRSGSERGAPAARAGRRKPAAQACPGRVDAGCPGAQGGAIKKVVGLQARREAVTVAMAEAGLSRGRACRLIPLWRGTMRYQARAGKRSQENEQLRARLRELADERKRSGYRRLHVLLEREGRQVNVKRVYRI